MAQESLSREQMGHLLADAPKGFSVRAYQPGLGRRAEKGYIVAVPGHGADYTPTASVDEAMNFVGSRKSELLPEDRYLGGYQGSEPPRLALDVSQLHPDTWSGHFNAAMQAVATNQEAYGHLGPGPEPPYTDLPSVDYDPERGGGGIARHAPRNVSLTQMSSVITRSHERHPLEGMEQEFAQPSRTAALSGRSRVER